MRDLRPFSVLLMLRRNRTAWEWAPIGGNTDWRPLEGSEGMIAPEAIVLTCDRFGHPVRHVADADVDQSGSA